MTAVLRRPAPASRPYAVVPPLFGDRSQGSPPLLVCVPRAATRTTDRWDRMRAVVELTASQVADQFPDGIGHLSSLVVSDPLRAFADWVSPTAVPDAPRRPDGGWARGAVRGRPADGTAGVRFDGDRSVTFLFEADDGTRYASDPLDLLEITG